jgi:hypothetical protein
MPDEILFDAPSAGGAQYELRASDDARAVTFTFSDLEVKVGDQEFATLTSKVAWMPLPLRGEGDPVRVEVSVSGYVFSSSTSGASLVFRLSGAQTSIDFPPRSDRSFVASLNCSSADVRGQVDVLVCLVAQRDDGKADPAVLNVLAVDARLVAL